MIKTEDSHPTPELPELQPLVAAVDGLARERKKLDQAIQANGGVFFVVELQLAFEIIDGRVKTAAFVVR